MSLLFIGPDFYIWHLLMTDMELFFGHLGQNLSGERVFLKIEYADTVIDTKALAYMQPKLHLF